MRAYCLFRFFGDFMLPIIPKNSKKYKFQVVKNIHAPKNQRRRMPPEKDFRGRNERRRR